MKKFIALVLALACTLALCACGGSSDEKYADILADLEKEDYDGAIAKIEAMKGQPETTQPVDEEALRLYTQIEAFLTGDQDSYFDQQTQNFYTGNDALARCYEQLRALEGVDTAPLLENFTVIENVPLTAKGSRTDAQGSTTEFSQPDTWVYDENGRVTERYIGSNDLFTTTYGIYGNYCYSYEGDLVSQIQVLESDGSVYAVITPAYNDSGVLVSDHIQTAAGEYDHTYSYDDQGQLSQMVRGSNYGNEYITDYTYNEAGQLVQEICEEFYTYSSGYQVQDATVVISYSYDESGLLLEKAIGENRYHSKTKLSTESADTVTYTYDENGVLLRETTAYGTITYSDSTEQAPEYAASTVTYTYGDYYVYNES